MNKYVFEVPEDWDLKKCFINIDKENGEIRIDKPVDHCISEIYKTKIIELNENDFLELEHRFGKWVRFVVEDIISGKEERWNKND